MRYRTLLAVLRLKEIWQIQESGGEKKRRKKKHFTMLSY